MATTFFVVSSSSTFARAMANVATRSEPSGSGESGRVTLRLRSVRSSTGRPRLCVAVTLPSRFLDVERGQLRVPPEEHAERRVHARGVPPFTASRSASSDASASVWWRMSSLMRLT